jgi:hypothetical protein
MVLEPGKAVHGPACDSAGNRHTPGRPAASGRYSGQMQLLLTALTTVQRASQILEAAGPGGPQTHRHWQQARVHLSAARQELLQALEGWKPSLPSAGAEGVSSDLCGPFGES